MAKREAKQEAPKAPAQPVATEPKVAFDAWWALVQKKMEPMHNHRKEVVMADFKARGLSLQESMATFNNALAQYGVKLK